MRLQAGDKDNFEDEYYKENDIVNKYTIIKLLGEGRYGIAYLALGDDDKKYVIKQLRKEMLDISKKKVFYEEIILKDLQYPCFPKFIDRFKDETREGYILEYLDGKVFEDLLREDGNHFSRAEIYEVCSQLIALIEILHSHNIVHRDIRPPNVIQNDNKELYLIDFGLARIMNHKSYKKEVDYWYLADFLIHLYYSSYQEVSLVEKPWYKELDLNLEEKAFLKRLMGIGKSYRDIQEIKDQLEKIKNLN
jgi:serine/threonine protein kinase